MANVFLDDLMDLITDKHYPGLLPLDRPFLQGKYIVATNGHCMLLVDKGSYPEYAKTLTASAKPDLHEALPDYEAFKDIRTIDKAFMAEVRRDTLYPYKVLQSALCFANEDCEDGLEPYGKYNIWDRTMNLMYLQLLEIVICFFGGEWKGHFPERKLAGCVFTNEKAKLVIMPMRPDEGRIT